MKAPPEEFDESALIRSLAVDWEFEAEVTEYANLGFGSYHWVVTAADGRRGFVTVDDLDRKSWLGNTRESVFEGLRRAFDTAVALQQRGVEFVVAPIPTSQGETVRRIGSRHTIALFPFVDGRAGSYGHYDTAGERAAVVGMLADLHHATPSVEEVARRADLELPGRRDLESALEDVNQTWSGGPFSEPARRVFAAHGADVAALLAVADRLAGEVATRGSKCVVTHGEPHAANVMRTNDRLLLVDWDTVALGPPERDLWMVVSETRAEADIYAAATGHHVDPIATSFFRVSWELADLAVYLDLFRSPHRHTEDAVAAYDNLAHIAAGCRVLAASQGSTLRPL